MWWSLFVTVAWSGTPAEDLMAQVAPLGPSVVIGLPLAENPVVAELRRLDSLDDSVALTVLVLTAADDPKVALPRAATSLGAPCAVYATHAGAEWSITRFGTCTVASSPAATVHSAPASAPPPSGDAVADLVPKLVAMRDWPARRAALTAAMGSSPNADDVGRLAAAMSVAASLEADGRNDPSIVKLFLQAGVSPDPMVRQEAMDAARAHGDPPMGAVSTPVAVGAPAVVAVPTAPTESSPPRVADAAALREYARDRWVRGTLTAVVGNQYGVGTRVSWSVYDGQGAPIAAYAFARAVNDKATLARMRRQADRFRMVAVGGAIVGTAGLVAMAAAPAWKDPVDGGMSDTGSAVMSAGAVAFGAGIGALPAALFPGFQKRFPVPNYYSTSRADGYIDGHNDALRDRLGLTEEDVVAIDTSK